MKTLIAFVLTVAAAAAPAFAGEVFGTIKEDGKPVKEGLKVTVTCGEKTVAGATDKNGAYRLFAAEEGKCTLTLHVGEETPATTVRSYEDSARYNLVLEKKDGKYVLKGE